MKWCKTKKRRQIGRQPAASAFGGPPPRNRREQDCAAGPKTPCYRREKLNIAAIENAVLPLPGVLDVKVREDFHNAKGVVTLTRAMAGRCCYRAQGQKVYAPGIPPNQKQYRRCAMCCSAPFKPRGRPRLKAFWKAKPANCPRGKRSNLKTGASWRTPFLIAFPFDKNQVGMAEVVVDSPEGEKIRPSVEQAVKSVRAAGQITVTVSGAKKVKTDGERRLRKIDGN